jgi:DNA-binding NarL/FixJ family response regulator
MAIRLVLADDHPVVLAGLAEIFKAEGDFEVVACVSDGAQALAAVREHKPDVLVLDLRMPVKDGVAVLREMKEEALPTPVVLMTAVDSGDLLEAIQLGVRGVVLKDMAAKLLVRAVREVHVGRKWIEKGTATQAMDKLLQREAAAGEVGHALTLRELQISRLVASGERNSAVAEKLSITEGTVKLHLHNIYRKLGIDGRMALVQYLRSKGLI